MLLPIGIDRPQEKIPWMNFLLIAANIVVYILSHHAPVNATDALLRMRTAGLDEKWASYMLNPASSPLSLTQFISYQFLHENLGHIFGNMIFLYVFGNSVNDKLGHMGYLFLYLAGGVIAGCGQVLGSSSPTLGASGAVSAIIGMFFVLLLRTNIRLFIFYFESMYFILFSFFRNLIEQHMGVGHDAYTAHITGTIFGFVIGLLLLLTGLVQRDQYDLLAVLDRWRRRRQYEAIVAGQRARLPPSSRPTEPLAQSLSSEISSLIRQRRLQEAATKYLELKSINGEAGVAAADLLDIANQLAAGNRFEEAALAYKDFLRLYPGAPHTEEVYFILGMIYARDAAHRQESIALLERALPLLSDPAQKKITTETLAHFRA